MVEVEISCFFLSISNNNTIVPIKSLSRFYSSDHSIIIIIVQVFENGYFRTNIAEVLIPL